MTDQHIPYDHDCPHCGWRIHMRRVWDAVICPSCRRTMWWVFDIQQQIFRLARIGAVGPSIVRFYHPAAMKFVDAFDNLLVEIREKRVGRWQRWSEIEEPYDEALWQEGAEL